MKFLFGMILGGWYDLLIFIANNKLLSKSGRYLMISIPLALVCGFLVLMLRKAYQAGDWFFAVILFLTIVFFCFLWFSLVRKVYRTK